MQYASQLHDTNILIKQTSIAKGICVSQQGKEKMGFDDKLKSAGWLGNVHIDVGATGGFDAIVVEFRASHYLYQWMILFRHRRHRRPDLGTNKRTCQNRT